jgi:hypothetical protein
VVGRFLNMKQTTQVGNMDEGGGGDPHQEHNQKKKETTRYTEKQRDPVLQIVLRLDKEATSCQVQQGVGLSCFFIVTTAM